MAYRVVIFDLGGVVVDVESDRLIHQIAPRLGHSSEHVEKAIYHQDLLLPLELGRISPHAYYERLKGQLGFPWTYGEFVSAWNDILREKTEVVRIIQQLHRHYTLTALTNTNILHLEHMKTQFPALSVFDDWVASCEVGLRKPDPQIYRLAMGRVGVQPDAAVYVDDRPELVEAGRAAGMTAIRFESHRQLEDQLRSLGFALNERVNP